MQKSPDKAVNKQHERGMMMSIDGELMGKTRSKDIDAYNRELIRKAKLGDTKAYNRLFEINDGFNYHMAKKFHNISDMDDLVDIARMGMMKAYNNFNPDMNTKFITYAAIIIRNDILMYARSTRRFRQEIYLDDILVEDDDGNGLSRMDILEDNRYNPEYIYDDKEKIQSLLSAVNKLDNRSKHIIESRYFKGKTQKDLAKELDISQSYVSRLERRIIKKLKGYMECVY